jgi:hypothetical protein
VDNQLPNNRSSLNTETLLLRFYREISVVLLFEFFPVWLPVIDPSRLSSLWIPMWSSEELFQQWEASQHMPSSLVSGFLSRLEPQQIHWGLFPDTNHHIDIWMVSGSLDFISHHLRAHHHSPMVAVVDSHFPKRLRKGQPSGLSSLGQEHCHWYKVRHEVVGGCTGFWGLLCSTIPVGLTTSVLRRTIGDFLDYSLRPTPFDISKPNISSIAFIRSDALLCPFHWDAVVAYATHFSRTGWGIRSLSPGELLKVFDFPARTRTDGLRVEHFNRLVPLSVLESWFRPWSSTLTSIEPERILLPGSPRRILPPVDETWIAPLQRFLPHSWIAGSLVTSKAAKRDDASAPTELWDQRLLLLFPYPLSFYNCLRTLLLRRLRRRLLRSFLLYLRTTYGSVWPTTLLRYRQELTGSRSLGISGRFRHKGGDSNSLSAALAHDVSQGAQVLYSFAGASWWEWDCGSTLVFWRWGPVNLPIARDGFVPYIASPLPKFRRRAPTPPSDKFDLYVEKLRAILTRRYVLSGPVKSLTQYFDVPKCDDIRMVYNGSSCGLNAALWTPNFWLPTPQSATRLLDFNFYSVDIDLGEMFLNYPLHTSLQAVSGIDITPFAVPLGFPPNKPIWLHWVRMWMGARPSPFFAVKYYYLAEEFIRGFHLDRNNIFHWSRIKFNLPGSPNYLPDLPWVMKWNDDAKAIANDLIAFVDDLRISGRTAEEAWQAGRVVASRLQYLGNQDAARKRRPPTLTPGAWAGAIFRVGEKFIRKSVTAEKWNKGRKLVQDLCKSCQLIDESGNLKSLEQDIYGNNASLISYKQLEIVRGFLGHLSMTFEILTPYLKGFHLTLAAHLPQRDQEGWKMSNAEWSQYLSYKFQNQMISEEEYFEYSQESKGHSTTPPTVVTPLPHLLQDLFALHTFFDKMDPPEINVRRSSTRVILYGFGDASGSGFGRSTLGPDGISCTYGVWGKDEENVSSNYREFSNIVSAVEEQGKLGNLKGVQYFLFTDNSTVEAGLHKGNTPSRKLFGLIVKLRAIQLQTDCDLFVSHVSGKRMMAQGTDGISRGNLKEGVASGQSMLSFIPLHLNALERQPNLKAWISEWAGTELEYLSPEDWFTRGHDIDGGELDSLGFWRPIYRSGTFVWLPSPASADVAMEELRKALIKRHTSTHIFICPRLLTYRWKKQLHKAADLVVSIPPGQDGWPLDMFEPLTLGFIFPFLDHPPWQLKSTPKMLSLARTMPGMFDKEGVAAGTILHEFFTRFRTIRTLSPGMVRRLLYFG